MILERIDRQLLAGDMGAAAQRAMKILCRYGQVLGAERFIDIASAHIDGCLYHGPSGLDFVKSFLGGEDRVRVPATLNVTAVDLVHPEYSVVDPSVTQAQRDMIDAYAALGCRPTLSCAPYQHLPRPACGQHVAWAESNAIVFANSVLGACTDRYGDFTDLCAALTGRVPLSGLHIRENRYATVELRCASLEESGLDRDLYFACVGYVLGGTVASRVAALSGLPADSSEDELKALGAAAASSGPVAMFHVIGVTPEAATIRDAAGGNDVELEHRVADTAGLKRVLGRLCKAAPGEPVAALCVGTPHFSLQEFRRMAGLVQGQRAAHGVDVLVSTSREIAGQVEAAGWAEPLRAFGMRIVVDTCTYLNPVALASAGIVVTNSAKWAHYAPGNIRRRSALMSLQRAVRCAVAGQIVP